MFHKSLLLFWVDYTTVCDFYLLYICFVFVLFCFVLFRFVSFCFVWFSGGTFFVLVKLDIFWVGADLFIYSKFVFMLRSRRDQRSPTYTSSSSKQKIKTDNGTCAGACATDTRGVGLETVDNNRVRQPIRGQQLQRKTGTFFYKRNKDKTETFLK